MGNQPFSFSFSTIDTDNPNPFGSAIIKNSARQKSCCSCASDESLRIHKDIFGFFFVVLISARNEFDDTENATTSPSIVETRSRTQAVSSLDG